MKECNKNWKWNIKKLKLNEIKYREINTNKIK